MKPDFKKLFSGLEHIKEQYEALLKQKSPTSRIHKIFSLLFSHDFIPGDEGKKRYNLFCQIIDQRDANKRKILVDLCRFYLSQKTSSRLVGLLGELLMAVFGIQCNVVGGVVQATAMQLENINEDFKSVMQRYINSSKTPVPLIAVAVFPTRKNESAELTGLPTFTQSSA